MKPKLYHSSWATNEDDSSLRRLTRETVQDRSVAIGMEREPSFFDSMLGVERSDTVVVRRKDEIIACGSRIERQAWLHQQEQPIAYLGDLKVHPTCRRLTGRVLQSGFERLRQLSYERPTAFTYTAIFDDNQQARSTLETARLGLPTYHPQGVLHTSAMFVPRRVRSIEALVVDHAEIAAFLNQRRRHRDLSPVIQPSQLQKMSTWIVLRQQDRIKGVAALCDLRAQRQIRAHRYPATLHLLNWLLKFCGYHPLPAVGELLPAVFVAYLEADNIAIAHELLGHLRHKASELKAGMLMLTQHESDPLQQVQRNWRAIQSRGRLYEVAWNASAPITSLHLPLVEGFSL